jgi:hypothetical protein
MGGQIVQYFTLYHLDVLETSNNFILHIYSSIELSIV